MKLRHLPRALALASAAAAGVALVLAWQWRAEAERESRWQQARSGPLPGQEVLASWPADVQLVAAERRRAEGHDDEAVRVLQALAVRADLDPATRERARYNLANALLREAGTALVAHEDDRALTLLQLAKQRLRESLRSQPEDWDARHNLQLALRLAPEGPVAADREAPTNVQRVKIDDRGIGGSELP